MIHCHLRNEYFATFDDDLIILVAINNTHISKETNSTPDTKVSSKTIDKPGKRGHIKLHLPFGKLIFRNGQLVRDDDCRICIAMKSW
jgi:hypothetical protein